MIKNEPYYIDNTPATVEDATEWIEVKQTPIHRDPYNYNFIRLTFDLLLKCPTGKKGQTAIFIDEEENPRATLEYDLPFTTGKHIEIDTYDLTYGKHIITFALKGSITNTTFRVGVLRIMTIYELTALLTPIVFQP